MAQAVIIVKEKTGSTEINFPWIPDEIKYKSGGVEFSTYKLLDMGEIARPSGSGLTEIAWEGMFPGESRKEHSFFIGEWKHPETYQAILNNWKVNKTLLKITISSTPINMYCYLKDFEMTYSGGAGDYKYQISFSEYRTVSVRVIVQSSSSSKKASGKKKKSAVKKTTKRPSSSSKTYEVKTGDCLWNISKRFLGKGTVWKRIYNLNKSVIEKVAKKHGKKSSSNGHWIFPGTKLKIPKK